MAFLNLAVDILFDYFTAVYFLKFTIFLYFSIDFWFKCSSLYRLYHFFTKMSYLFLCLHQYSLMTAIQLLLFLASAKPPWLVALLPQMLTAVFGLHLGLYLLIFNFGCCLTFVDWTGSLSSSKDFKLKLLNNSSYGNKRIRYSFLLLVQFFPLSLNRTRSQPKFSTTTYMLSAHGDLIVIITQLAHRFHTITKSLLKHCVVLDIARL